ncbi:MAG: transcription termination/antitermination protein NusG [Deltaproteobacteria bacterium]|nr:transcription termination/antitermination protein NusG [Deltaproteobacteria bacterium]
MALKWYVVHTFSGYENRVKLSLEERVVRNNLQDQITQVILPQENVMAINKAGTKQKTTRKLFPGYLFVQMELNEMTLHVIKETPKVTGFLGVGKDSPEPEPISDEEASRILSQLDEGKTLMKPRYNFEEGDQIKVIDGPFNNFTGLVEEVNEDKGKLKVLISIFGRPTPVELDFAQVDKVV